MYLSFTLTRFHTTFTVDLVQVPPYQGSLLQFSNSVCLEAEKQCKTEDLANNRQWCTFTGILGWAAEEQFDHCLTQLSGADPDNSYKSKVIFFSDTKIFNLLSCHLNQLTRSHSLSSLMGKIGDIRRRSFSFQCWLLLFSRSSCKIIILWHLQSHNLCCASNSSSTRDNIMLAHCLATTLS